MIKVALADDHELVRYGIKMVLEDDPEIDVVWEAADGQEALAKMAQHKVDVLVADINMPLLTGLEVTRKLKQEDPAIKIIVLTMHDDAEYILEAMRHGADGYLLKDTNKAEFNKAVKLVYSGQKYFSGDISATIVDSFLQGAQKGRETASQNASPSQNYGLTKREKEILRLIYDGIANKEIAKKLNKSVRTIETHRFNIMKKLDVSNITELLKKLDREGLITDP